MTRALLIGALFVCACSSGGGGGAGGTSGAGGSGGSTSGKSTLTCAWLEGPDNCWQAAVDQAYAECAVEAADEGWFGDDEYLSCNYPNGDSDVYGASGHFYVEAHRDGSQCFTFEAAPQASQSDPVALTLTTRSGTVTSVWSSDDVTITCADGSTLSASGIDMLQLFSCKPRQYADGTSLPPWPGYLLSKAHLAVLPPPLPESPGTLTSCTCAPEPPPSDGGIPPPQPGCPGI